MLLALPTNIRLGWKGLQGTNTSILQTLINYGHKDFITLCPDVKFAKLYLFVSDKQVKAWSDICVEHMIMLTNVISNILIFDSDEKTCHGKTVNLVGL
jgi:hypothetical protein